MAMALVGIAMLAACAYQYKDWLYYFATLDPHETSGAAAITALSAMAGVLLVCISGVVMWFITGDTKSVLAKMQFNASTVAQTALSSAADRKDSVEEKIFKCEKLDPKDLDAEAFNE